MGETPDEIERHIYEKRSELGENINELQQKVKRTMDWRAQVEERPMMMMGLAFGGGVLLSLLFGGGSHRSSRKWSTERSRRQSRTGEYGSQSYGSGQSRLSEYSGSSGMQERENQADSMWNNIRNSLLAVAGARLGGVIEEVLPGFQEHFRKRQGERPSSSTSRPNGPESYWRKTASGETDYNPQS
jgi:hypothetical protein